MPASATAPSASIAGGSGTRAAGDGGGGSGTEYWTVSRGGGLFSRLSTCLLVRASLSRPLTMIQPKLVAGLFTHCCTSATSCGVDVHTYGLSEAISSSVVALAVGT
jgi:hypothetical protein